jgi:hypothetical protein
MSNIKRIIKISLILALLVFISSLLNTVRAQTIDAPNEDFSISVHPPVSYVYVKPSEKLRHTLIVKNTGRRPLSISTNVTDFKPDGKTGQPVIQPGRIFNKEANPDLSFGEPFTLQPGRSHSVNLQFDVAEVVQEKEYPLAILINAHSLSPKSSDQDGRIQNATKAQVAGTVVSNLIVYIGHDEDNQGKIEIAQLNLPLLIDSFSGISFDILAQNSGSTATLIQGKAVIENIFQQTISEYIFYPDFVLAESTRMVRGVEFSPDLLDNDGLLDPKKVDNLFTRFVYKPPILIGVYNVHLELSGLQQTETVIALPFSIIAAVGVGFLLYWSHKQVLKATKNN